MSIFLSYLAILLTHSKPTLHLYLGVSNFPSPKRIKSPKSAKVLIYKKKILLAKHPTLTNIIKKI